MSCECDICQAIDQACARLVKAGICLTSKDAGRLIDQVTPYSINRPHPELLKTLRLLGGEHGATLYQILLIRKEQL